MANFDRRGSREICGLYYNSTLTTPWQTQRHYLPQVKIVSHTTITSICYTTALRQTFGNPNDDLVSEARYTFPLYDGVAVSSYTITYGDTILKGIVKQNEAAKKTYQAAVDKGETAGLLESLPAGVFGVTIGNLPSKTDVHVDITYCGELKHDAEVDGLRYTLPTSIAPRYGDYPGELLQCTAVNDGGIGITVDVDMGKNSIRKIQSPSHPVAVSMGAFATHTNPTYEPSKASAGLTLGTTELAGDFVLQFDIDNISAPQAIVEQHPDLPSRAVVATLVPRFELEVSCPEIVFIADQSGSMGGPKNKALVSALNIFIKSLPVGVRFNICAFGSRYKFLWPTSQAYNQSSMEQAIAFVNTFDAGYGGTELLKPVVEAFDKRLGDLPFELMLLTDGEIWHETELFESINGRLKDSKAGARVFALGIGNDVSHTLVEGVARAGNGFAQFVGQDEETDRKVIRMLKGALYPHITDCQVEIAFENNIAEDHCTDADDDFEIVERVKYQLNIEDDKLKEMDKPAATSSRPFGVWRTPMSFFSPTANVDKPIKSGNEDPYVHLPPVDPPATLQAPSELPSLFPFNRTTFYLLLGPEAPNKPVKSVTLKANSPQGPLELAIDIPKKDTSGTTIHQLAARRAIQELEEGRGWLHTAKTAQGTFVKDVYKSRFDELVEREAVRLGERFQVAAKWTSFVAVRDGIEVQDGTGVQGGTEETLYADQRRKKKSSAYRGAGGALSTGPAGSPALMMQCSASPIRPRRTRQNDISAQAPQRCEESQVSSLMGYSLSSTSQDRFIKPATTTQFHRTPLARPFGQAPRNIHACMSFAEDSLEAEDDAMGLSPDMAVDDQIAQPAKTSGLHALINLQTFAGAWHWNDDLFFEIGRKESEKRPAFDAAFGNEDVMATALAVAYMETNLTADVDVWEMVVQKAKQWMGTQVDPSIVDDLINKAKALILKEV
ncbi:hypothetical protein Q7P37_004753 [Cladosporium fusiforme]